MRIKTFLVSSSDDDEDLSSVSLLDITKVVLVGSLNDLSDSSRPPVRPGVDICRAY